MFQVLNNNDLDIINSLLISFKQSSVKEVTSTYIIYKDDDIKGIINYKELSGEAELYYIYIKDIYRHMGYATKLVNYMFADLKNKKINKVFLEVRSKNTEALNLYKKMGFKEINRRIKYYGDDDAIIMEVII